jgi:hypothetical protein
VGSGSLTILLPRREWGQGEMRDLIIISDDHPNDNSSNRCVFDPGSDNEFSRIQDALPGLSVEAHSTRS